MTAKQGGKTVKKRCHNQWDQIERFWNFLAANFITKVAKISGDFLGNFKNYYFLSRTGVGTFWARFGNTCPTSGHTARNETSSSQNLGG